MQAARIRTSGLESQSVAIGGATLVLKSALEDSRLFPAIGSRSAIGSDHPTS